MRGVRSFGPMNGERIRRHQALVRSSREPVQGQEVPEGLIITTYEVKPRPEEYPPNPLVRGLCPVCGAGDASEGCDGERDNCPLNQPLPQRRVALELMAPNRLGGDLINAHLSVEDAVWLRGVLDEYISANSKDRSWGVVPSGREGWLLLAHPDHDGPDGFRLVVSTDYEDEGPTVREVYPCRVCGWNDACAEGCHS